jgi:hypothetical protein
MQIVVQFESPFAFVNDKHEASEREKAVGEQREVGGRQMSVNKREINKFLGN